MEFMSTAVSFLLAVIGGALMYRWPKSKWRSIVKWPGLAIFLLFVSITSAVIEYHRATAAIYDYHSADCRDAQTSCLVTGDTQACGVYRLCSAVSRQRADDEVHSLSLNLLRSMFTSVLWDFPVEVIGVALGVILAGGRPMWSHVEDHLDE